MGTGNMESTWRNVLPPPQLHYHTWEAIDPKTGCKCINSSACSEFHNLISHMTIDPDSLIFMPAVPGSPDVMKALDDENIGHR